MISGQLTTPDRFSYHTASAISYIGNSRFLQRPQKRSRGNQLIHKRVGYPKQNRSATGQIQSGRKTSDGYGIGVNPGVVTTTPDFRVGWSWCGRVNGSSMCALHQGCPNPF